MTTLFFLANSQFDMLAITLINNVLGRVTSGSTTCSDDAIGCFACSGCVRRTAEKNCGFILIS